MAVGLQPLRDEGNCLYSLCERFWTPLQLLCIYFRVPLSYYDTTSRQQQEIQVFHFTSQYYEESTVHVLQQLTTADQQRNNLFPSLELSL